MGRGRKWSNEEENYLDECWGKTTLAGLSTQLKRTKKAVVIKSKKMNLGASTTADEYLTANQTAILLNKSTHTIIKWIKKYDLKAVRKTMLYRRQFWLIKHGDLLKWLKNNQDKFDSRKIDFINFGYEPEWLQWKKEKDKKLPEYYFNSQRYA